jgi:ABC-2 type transport system permease protein
MNFRHQLTVFVAAAKLGFKEIFAEPIVLLGSFLTYATLIIAYGNVFKGISPEDLAANHLTLSEMIWYFGATELTFFCCSSVHFREVQNDIQNEQIHLSLLRPCPVWVVRIGEWAGQSVARFLSLIIPSLAVVLLMAGGITPNPARFLGFIASLPLATTILLCSYFMIGVSCLWMKQSEPTFWIWQKALFFFGALLWPFALYPPLLRQIAWLTPFPAILAAPAQWTLNIGDLPLLKGFAHQVFWTVVFVALVAAVNRAVLRRLQDSGE